MLQLKATCSDPTHTCNYIDFFLIALLPHTAKHLLHMQLKQKNVLHVKHFGLIQIARPLQANHFVAG